MLNDVDGQEHRARDSSFRQAFSAPLTSRLLALTSHTGPKSVSPGRSVMFLVRSNDNI